MTGPCPRCRRPDTRVLAESPIAGAWTLYSCRTCTYSWRSTEPAQVTDPRYYAENFRVDPDTIDTLPVVPTVPPRR